MLFRSSGKATKYGQLFAKVQYTMTPRSIVASPSEQNQRGQVLPAFITNITDPDNYSSLSQEQKEMKYIISGMNKTNVDGEYKRSSDGHVIYGAEPTKPRVLDVPLGGDINPPVKTGETYEWSPKYQGALLYPYENPEPLPQHL